ncbi:MAG: flagellar biosynthesis protein FlhB [Oligoflexia bacterium]|nr:flagellar biosynthesis protein FlhB [Oligoflexia bacterium]
MADGGDSLEERSEEATTQRREDFRKQGQVAQSREVTSILVLIGVASVFYFMSRQFLLEIQSLFSLAFTEQFVAAARHGDILPPLKLAFIKGGMIVLPVFAITIVMGIGATVLQIGFLTAWDHINFDIERLNPITGFTKIFNMRSIVEGIKSVIKIAVVGITAYFIVKNEIAFSPQLVQMSTAQILVYMGTVVFKLIGGICILMAFVAALDYGYLRWDLEKRMRMTKQEIKEEFKQREGDPLIKSRIKRIQRELSQRRMMEEVPKADVIITNPTHIAIALKYDRVAMAAPVMVAKGADFIAEKIKEVARKHNIPIVENKPLARNMFKNIKLGHPIPRSLYNAVAEVLAYVYRIKGKIQQVSQEIAKENPNGLGGA